MSNYSSRVSKRKNVQKYTTFIKYPHFITHIKPHHHQKNIYLNYQSIIPNKHPICHKKSLFLKSLYKFVRDSYFIENNCHRSWSPSTKINTQSLWLPLEHHSPGFHPKGTFQFLPTNSWFSMQKWIPQKETEYIQIPPRLSVHKPNVKESITKDTPTKTRTSKLKKSKKPPANSCKKIRLDPVNKLEYQKLKKWFGDVRFTYNWSLSCIQQKPYAHPKNIIYLRKRFINQCNISKDKRFLLDTPKQIRDTAVIQLVEAFRSNQTKKRKDPSFQYQMQFKKKKDTQNITIPQNVIKLILDKQEMSMYPSYLQNKIRFHLRKNRTIPHVIENDCHLILDELKRIYLIIPYHEKRSESACENQASLKSPNSWVALDPGVREIFVLYSNVFGECYKFGKSDICKIFRACRGIDKLMSKCDKCKNKNKRYRYRKAMTRQRMDIKNLVDDIHKKIVHFLVSRFQNIIIPSFNVQQMIKRETRKIGKKTTRMMVNWKHYAFRKRLMEKALKVGVNVYVCGEEYTSKTCSRCHHVKHNLGGSKTFVCDRCGLELDRDVNGARNILAKNVTLSNR